MALIRRHKREADSDVDISRQLGNKYIQIFKILEKMKELEGKLDENQRLMRELHKKYVKMGEKKLRAIPYRTRTRSAIKLILKKHSPLSSDQLCKLIGLSRTRCNEYLKELENSGAATTKIVERKK